MTRPELKNLRNILHRAEHENDRHRLLFLKTYERLQVRISAFFCAPEPLVFGSRAAQAKIILTKSREA